MIRPSTLRLRSGLVILLLTFSRCGGQDDGSAGTNPPVTSPTAVPTLVKGDTLSSGRYALRHEGMQMTFEAEGWEAWAFGVVAPEGASPPGGRGLSFSLVDEVYADPCRWNRGFFDPPVGPTVDDLAVALTEQPGTGASRPEPVELAGYTGEQMQLQVPRSIRLDECWNTEFHLWSARPYGGRYVQGPGQIDKLWILDVDGTPLVIDAAYFPETSSEDREELMDIVESVRIE
jgi:hypothetical protein